MRKQLILATAALALMSTACARKAPPPEAGLPPAGDQVPVPPGVDPADVELTELPAMQADLVAKAG